MVNVMLLVALDPETDSEAGERAARGLRAEIAELGGVEDVRSVPGGPAPEGAKGSDAGGWWWPWLRQEACSPRWSRRCVTGSAVSPRGIASR